MDRQDVTAFRALLTPAGRRLLETLPPYDESSALRVGAQLRADGHDATLVNAALSQARLRARGRRKFGEAADRMFFTRDGLEQATRPAVAAGHARRYVEAGVTDVLDLCCGIGGDLPAFAVAGLMAVGIDHDPLTCEVATANVEAVGLADRARVRCADVTGLDDWAGAKTGGAFIDPARRGGRGRTFELAAMSPPYAFVLELAAGVSATGAKLGPGIPHHALPAGAEAQWVSDGGDVVECALWFGPLSTGVPRRATLLPGGATLAGSGSGSGSGFVRGEVGPVGRWLYEPDGAVIRSGLVAEAAALVDGRLVDPTIAYVTADRLVESPFLTAYEVTDVLPFGLKRLRALLRSRGVGRLTVKKRGSAIAPEALRHQLRLSGSAEATIVLTRVAGQPTVLVVEPALPRHDHAKVVRPPPG